MLAIAMWIVGAGCVLLAPSGSRADVLEVPAEVWAEEDGSFRYPVTFRKEWVSDRLAGYSWYGEVNVLGGVFQDCRCLPSCPLFAPGDSLVFEISGRLTFPNLPGRVTAFLDLCTYLGVSGQTVIHDYTSGGPPGPPDTRFWNEPNPFASHTTFRYHLTEAGRVTLTIHDLVGRVVARVVDQVQGAGPQVATWEVPTAPGLGMGGVLFARLTMPGEVRSQRLLVVR